MWAIADALYKKNRKKHKLLNERNNMSSGVELERFSHTNNLSKHSLPPPLININGTT